MLNPTEKIWGIALLVALSAASATAVGMYLRLGHTRTAFAEYKAQAESDRAKAAAVAASAIASARDEGERRSTQQMENLQDELKSVQAAHADARAAVVAAGGLRQRAATVAAGCRAAAVDPAAAPASAPAQAPGDLLADVLGRLEEAGRQLAATADERGSAGRLCERNYDALTVPDAQPH